MMILIRLPEITVGTLQQLIARRRSVRDYSDEPLSLAEASSLLWAAQGITGPGLRTTPSAGALYPLETYLLVGNVGGMLSGIYRHLPEKNAVELLEEGDRRSDLGRAAMEQHWLAEAALIVVFAARYRRTTFKYGSRGIRYAHIEVGHAAQNVLLTAVSLNLGAAEVGAFDDEAVSTLLRLHREETPLYLLPVGHPK